MANFQKTTLIILTLSCCFGCDQLTKRVAKKSLEKSPPISYLGETFRLQYAENSGAFLSLGSSLPKVVRTWLFTFFSGALLAALCIYIVYSRSLNRSHTFALSLILGGGFSNLFDRIVNDGKVIDFMNMGIGPVRTGIFNLADVVIMVGMGLIILYNFTDKKFDKPESGPPPDSE